MEVKVVDASAVAALLFGEPKAEEIAAWFGVARLAAPTLLAYEVANIGWKKARRHPELRDKLLAAHRLFGALAIDSVVVDHHAVLLLALETGLTGYDASYLWLARQLNAELVTLDKRLAAAYAASS